MNITKTMTKMVPRIQSEKVKAGIYAVGTFSGKKVVGKIQRDGQRILLCQNDINGTNTSKPRFGFAYVTSLGDNNTTNWPTDIQFYSKLPKGVVPSPKPIIIDGYAGIINKDSVQFGCKKVPKETILQIAKRIKK